MRSADDLHRRDALRDLSHDHGGRDRLTGHDGDQERLWPVPDAANAQPHGAGVDPGGRELAGIVGFGDVGCIPEPNLRAGQWHPRVGHHGAFHDTGEHRRRNLR
jgi:hypothetical protein